MNEISTNWAACIVYYQDQESLLNLLASLDQQSLKPGGVFITDNNSIQSLTEKGTIFIDDILPFNYNEQLKVPIKHYYENGILKYGENWTGDIWKVVYHLIKNYRDKISDFKYFYNINFRGIGMFKFKETFKINTHEIDKINSYDYFKDYKLYINELQSFTN